MNPFEGNYKVEGQMSFSFCEEGNEVRRAKRQTIVQDRNYYKMEQAGMKAEEPKMVQYAREYRKKVEEIKSGEKRKL